MYINNIHILYYFFIGLLGLAVGQVMNWANVRLENHEKVFCKEFFTTYIPHMKVNFFLIIPIAIIYIALLYLYGFQMKLLEFLILTPLIISALVIDYRKQIIPNRLTLTIFEIGIIFTFISGLSDINVFLHRILGMIAGGGIFLIITLIGGLIAGKEAMGFGDVKLMGALGITFGLSNTIMIAVISFLLGAIISIILLATKKKKSDEYIPFGPFIVLATFLIMFVPHYIMLLILLKIFTLGTFKI